MKEYVLGSGVELSLETRDRDGALADPSSIDLVITRPGGTVDTYALADLARMSLGKFRLDVVGDELGVWKPVWTTNAGDASQGVVADPFYVYNPT